jgi:hypothetical protein
LVTETGIFAARVDISNLHSSDPPYDHSTFKGALLRFAEQRVRAVAQVLKGRDLAYIAHLAAQVLEEGCEVMAVMQQRLAQQAT